MYRRLLNRLDQGMILLPLAQMLEQLQVLRLMVHRLDQSFPKSPLIGDASNREIYFYP